MPNRDSRFFPDLHAIVLALLTTGALATAATPALAQDGAPAATPSAPSDAGMKVNIDPKTGRLLEEPAPDTASKRAVAAPPIVLEPSPVEGGGMVLRPTDRRFDAEIQASVGPDGKADVGCEAPAK
jgi:hypothetical protein